ncbi:MAG: V4R domain-containing protein, partial [Candidatus Geothermarchaeales archaeon]
RRKVLRTARMRFVKISQPEIEAVRKLYESVMSYACHGLFFREGLSLGADIAEMASKSGDYFESCRRILIGRGWVEDVSFGDGEVRVKDSIEASPGTGTETCHRLKGIISKIYESEQVRRLKFTEQKCVSKGDSECVFRIEG